MNVRFMKHAVVAALALGLAFATSARAQDATLQVRFGTHPHWESVRGTHVRVIRDRDRPDYDVFRYGGWYYAYNNDHWYRSHRAEGDYRAVDDRDVPSDFQRVPRERWRNYPSTWPQRNDMNDMRRHHHRRY
jgi:hypothetical protein